MDSKGIYPDLMNEFLRNGHHVYIISPIHNNKKQKNHVIEGDCFKIIRLMTGDVQKTNLIRKGISTLTIERKFLKAIKSYCINIVFDLICYSTPPITFNRVVNYIKTRDNALSYLLLKDIFPQNALDLGILKLTGLKGIIYRYFRLKEKILYSVSDYIGCMSMANVTYLIEHNPVVDSSKVEVCANSIRIQPWIRNDPAIASFREKHGLPSDKTIFVYAGNLGVPQGIEFLIQCLVSNIDKPDVFFVIAGSGTEFERIINFMKTCHPTNVRVLEHLSQDQHDLLMQTSDVGLIFLDKRFTIPNFPSRILSYMEASLPIIATTDKTTDIRDVLENSGAGLWSESGDISAFNRNINKLSASPEKRKEMGLISRKFMEDHYNVNESYKTIISHFNKGFETNQ